MANLPRVSVITVTRNLIQADREQAFVRAVNCVQAQGGDGIEHLIQDGASDDGTLDLIDRTVGGLTNVKLLSEPDGGLYDGMNRAVARARGDYVLFLNSDDALASDDVLRRMQGELARHDPDFAYGATASQDSQGRMSVSRRTSLDAVLQRMPFCHNSVLIRRSVFAGLGGHDLHYKVAADYDFVLRMVAAGSSGLRVDMAVSLFWTRGVSANDDTVATDYAGIWQKFFAGYRSAQGLDAADYRKFYFRGHMPVRLMYEVMTDRSNAPAIRAAARHGLAKSLRRAMQPWRNFDRVA